MITPVAGTVGQIATAVCLVVAGADVNEAVMYRTTDPTPIVRGRAVVEETARMATPAEESVADRELREAIRSGVREGLEPLAKLATSVEKMMKVLSTAAAKTRQTRGA